MLPPVCKALSQTTASASANILNWRRGREKKAKKPECQLCSVLRLTWLNSGRLRNEINYKKASIIQKHLHLLYSLWEQHLLRADLNYSNPPHSQFEAWMIIKEVLLVIRANHPGILALPLFVVVVLLCITQYSCTRAAFPQTSQVECRIKSCTDHHPHNLRRYSAVNLPAWKIQLDHLIISPINTLSGKGENLFQSSYTA